MAIDIDAQLGKYKPKSYTVRLCDGVSRILPFAPELVFYGSLERALGVLSPGAGPAALSRARAIAEEPGPQEVLRMANLLDRADAGLSIYTGLSSAVKLYKAGEGQRAQALRSDSQQAMDAVLKGLGLAWMVRSLFQGGVQQRVERFLALDAGRHMASYYAAIEVGLPFADNAAAGVGGVLAGLFQRHEGQQLEKLSGAAGADDSADTAALAHALIEPMEGMVQRSSAHLSAIMTVVAEAAPQVVDMADKIASVAATGADALPVWRFLGARLVAEYAVRRAVDELGEAPALSEPSAAPPHQAKAPDRAKASGRSSALLFAIIGLLIVAGGGLAAYVLVAEPSADTAASDGAASDGAASDGAASDGAASDGAASDGAASKTRGGVKHPRARPGRRGR